MSTGKKQYVSIVIGFALLATAGTLFHWRRNSAVLYSSHESPDARYKVEVYEYPQFWGHLLGDSGGGAGYVQLLESKHGRVLVRERVDPVLLIETIRWTTTAVSIKLFADWNLPELSPAADAPDEA